MDSRTGLGRFRDFRISNYELMMQLIDYCREASIEEILALPDVAERVELYEKHKADFAEQILRCSTVHDNLVGARSSRRRGDLPGESLCDLRDVSKLQHLDTSDVGAEEIKHRARHREVYI